MMHVLFSALLLAAAPDYSKMMASGHIAAMQALVVQDGKIVSEQNLGVRNMETKAPVDEHTHFEVGSITKQFTAAAILQLRDAGKLSLDDKLGKYFPQYTRGKDVTLRQMLLQVSGIPDYTDTKGFGNNVKVVNGRFTIAKPGSPAGVIALIKDKKLDFTPGSKWEYSNSNYYLLGEIVGQVSHMPWSAYIAKNVFAKAGMTESGFMPDEPHFADMATGYTYMKNAWMPTGTFTGWAEGAGAIVSTARDMAKWDDAFFSGRIVPQADVDLITTPGTLPAMGKAHYGMGWLVDQYDGQPRLWHNGGTLGFNASNQVYLKSHEAVIVLDSGGFAADSAAQMAFDALHPELTAGKDQAAAGEDAAVTARAKDVWKQILSGNIDRTQFTADANKAFTPDVIVQAKAQLSTFGDPATWVYKGSKTDKGLTAYRYRVTFSSGMALSVVMALDVHNKIAAYYFVPAAD